MIDRAKFLRTEKNGQSIPAPRPRKRVKALENLALKKGNDRPGKKGGNPEEVTWNLPSGARKRSQAKAGLLPKGGSVPKA